MSGDEYSEHRESYDGFCTGCDAVTVGGGVEPDARGYNCPVCGMNTVVGMEEALIDGLLEIED